MVAKLKTTKNSKQARKKQPEKQAAATVFRVICLFAAVGILVLDATIVTFDYPAALALRSEGWADEAVEGAVLDNRRTARRHTGRQQ